jgi:hypothetical protein
MHWGYSCTGVTDAVELVSCVLQSLGRLDEPPPPAEGGGVGGAAPSQDRSLVWLPRDADLSLLPVLHIGGLCGVWWCVVWHDVLWCCKRDGDNRASQTTEL